jgi:hypothetical protein
VLKSWIRRWEAVRVSVELPDAGTEVSWGDDVIAELRMAGLRGESPDLF